MDKLSQQQFKELTSQMQLDLMQNILESVNTLTISEQELIMKKLQILFLQNLIKEEIMTISISIVIMLDKNLQNLLSNAIVENILSKNSYDPNYDIVLINQQIDIPIIEQYQKRQILEEKILERVNNEIM